MNKIITPTELCAKTLAKLRSQDGWSMVDNYKRTDCTNYNTCLGVAVDNNWDGFGCNSCLAFKPIDMAQRQLDHQGLIVACRAAENVSEGGSANRRRGVKPGSHREKVRLPIIADRMEGSDSIELLRKLVLA